MLYLESVKERTKPLGMLYPPAYEQKGYTKELKEDHGDKSMKNP